MIDPFPVSRGAKNGCALSHVLFDLYVQYVTQLLHRGLANAGGAHVSYRTDCRLFDLRKLKAHSKTQVVKVCEMQYADDCALL